MQPTRILPDLQSSLLCEDVRQEISGNFILVGIIAYVRVPKLPITAMKVCVFNRWTAGVGQFTEIVRLIGPDQTTVLRKSEVKFGLKNASHNATNVTVFTQLEFGHEGVFYVEILVDDVMKLRFPLPVMIVKPSARKKPPESPAPPEAL